MGGRTSTLLAAVLFAALLAPPAGAAVTRSQATSRALAALGTARGDDPAIVFGVRSAVRSRAVVTEAGPDDPRTVVPGRALRRAGVVLRHAAEVIRAGDEPAWLFFEDRGPNQAFEHPGRVALVGTRTGTVRISRRTRWVPLVDGRRPPFFRSARAYASRRYRVFARSWTGAVATRARPRQTPGERLDATFEVARTLAAERSCALRISDTLGDFYAFGGAGRVRSRLRELLDGLELVDAGFRSERYATPDGRPTRLAQRMIDGGCRDLLLYAAGAADRTEEGHIVIGTRPASGGRVAWHVLTSRELEELVKRNPGVTFKFLFDAPHNALLNADLGDEPNVTLLLASGGPDNGSFTYLPELLVPGAPGRAAYDPAGLLDFTRAMVTGMEAFVTSTAEIANWRAHRAGGNAPSLLGWMLARALGLAPGPLFIAPLDQLRLPFVAAPRPPVPPAAPSPANHGPVPTTPAQATVEDTPRGITLTADDADGDALTFTVTDGPDHGSLAGSGADLTYTPDRDFNGPDSFAYTVADGRGGAGSATVQLAVAPVNDAATVSPSAGTPQYTEDGAAVVLDGALTIADPDSAQLEGASVRIASGLRTGDELTFADTATIDGEYAAGVLTLTGTDTLASYQAALRSVRFTTTNQHPRTSRTIEFRAEDGDDPGPAATRGLTVVPVNDAPTVATTPSPRAYTEGAGAVVVDGGVTVGDVDSATLTGATVTITGNLAPAEDVLAFTDQGAITGAYDAATGTLTLSGTATPTEYRTALRSVTYENTSQNPSTATRTITFQVDDGDALSNAATRDVTITAT